MTTSSPTDGASGDGERGSDPLTKADFEELARFRFGIRRYLRVSEEYVRSHGLTAQRYQLLLALKGFPGRDWASVSELAERLQVRHHSVVELVDRTEQQGLVQRASHPDDARAVRVQLTRSGEQALARLDQLHRDELRRIGVAFRTLQWDALLEQDGGDGDRPAPERRTGR